MSDNETFDQNVMYKKNEIIALLKGSKAILAHNDFETCARLIFDTCKELIGAQAGYIALLSDDGSENEVLFLDPGEMNCTVDESLPMPIRGLRSEAYQREKTVYHNDFAHSDFVKYMPEGHVHLQNVLFAPLIIDGKTVGLMGLSNKPEDFTDHDAELASAFGEYAAISLNNSRMLDRLNKAKTDLKAFNQELEQRIEERTQKIKHLLQQKDNFIVQLGHDLKTPLGPIINLVPLIEEKEQDAKLKKLLSVVNKSSMKLHNLVRKTMKYAYVTSSEFKPDYEKVNIHDLVQRVLESKKDDCEQLGIHINNKMDVTLMLITDRKLVQEIFDELLSNAMKFSQGRGTITIDYIDNGKSIQFSIKDTGIGLTSSQIEHIFDEFYKTDESRHDLNSHGLGLPIVKTIVEKLDGTIWIGSDGPGKGSTFYFILPKKGN